MSVVIGKISSIDGGKFYVKAENGSLRELNKGDLIHEGETIVGNNSNNPTDSIVLNMKDGSDIVVLATEEQLFDASLYQEEFAENETTTHDDTMTELLKEYGNDLDDIKTAEGEEVGAGPQSTEGGEAVFSKFNEAATDIKAGLRERMFEKTVIKDEETSEEDDILLTTLLDADETATSAPTVTINDDNNPDDGSLTTAEANGTTTDYTITVPTDALVGDILNVTVDGAAPVAVTITQDIIDNGYTSFVPTLAEGETLTVSATITDAAGNTSSSASDTTTRVNDAPTANSSMVETLEDTVYTFSASDFNFTDSNNDLLNAIRIDSLPVMGELLYNGNAVTEGQEIDVANIGLLTFTPDLNDSGSDQYSDDIIDQTSVGDQLTDYAVFNFSVNDGISWSESTSTMTVDVDAVADAPILSVTSTNMVTKTIDVNNFEDTNNGFSITALSADGSLSSISTNNDPLGFGVAGVASGDDNELGYLTGIGSESIVVTFDDAVTSIDVALAWIHSGETASFSFYLNGIVVGSSSTMGIDDKVDPVMNLAPTNGSLFDKIVFSAPSSGDDYLIHSISFELPQSNDISNLVMQEDSPIALNIDASLTDTDGSESLSVIINDIPAGSTISDGINTYTAPVNSIGSIDVTTWNLDILTFNIPNIDATSATYTLNVVATSTEFSNSDTATTTIPINITVIDKNYVNLSNDSAVVEENVMITGTDNDNLLTADISNIATGNLYANDDIGANFSLSNITILGGTTDISVAGQITVTTKEGNILVVNTDTGDYTYTLNNAVDHRIISETGNTVTLTDVNGDVANDTFSSGLDSWTGSNVAQSDDNRLLIDGGGDNATKTFDFGSNYADKTVTISFDLETIGDWDGGNDNFIVTANGVQVSDTSYEDGTYSYSFSATLDANGKVVMDLLNSSGWNGEDALIDNFVITGPELSITNLDSLIDSFTYTVSDSLGVDYTANLDVTIQDDAPIVNNTTAVSVSLFDNPTTNLVLTLDVSGSMRVDVNGSSRFEIAKAALIDTINGYNDQGAANVNLTMFNTKAVSLGWMNATDAITYINLLTMDSNGYIYHNGETISDLENGWTNYEAAIDVTSSTYSINTPVADKTVAYFISDGIPTKEYNDDTLTVGDVTSSNTQDNVDGSYIDNNYLSQWDTFINSNDIALEVIGIGSGLDETYLNTLQVINGKSSVLVTDETQLSAVMLSSIESVNGSLFDMGASNGVIFGADGGHILEITYSGITYSYNSENVVQDISLTEGIMALNFETGTYVYTPTLNSGVDITENFIISITDADGDTALEQNLNMVIGINETFIYADGATIDGGAGIDTLIFEDDNLVIDFSTLSNNVDNIENINLNGANQDVTLTLDDVMNITDDDNTLRIDGLLGDTLHIDTNNVDTLNDNDEWKFDEIITDTQTGQTYNQYSSIDSTVTLEISTKITVDES